MRIKKQIVIGLLSSCIWSSSCRDESLYPLPYNDRTTSAYLRMYRFNSNVFDLTNLATSFWQVELEAVDEHYGDDLEKIDFYVSHRRGTDLTYETLLKTVDASIFSKVNKPTYSQYKRGTVTISAQEALSALRTITTDPDGDGTANQCPKCVPLKGLAAFGANGAFQAGDVINVRWEMILKDGRKISAANPQTSVNPSYANYLTSNSTTNITTGQFYSSPFLYPITVRSLTTNSWAGTYALKQRAIWSPNHSLQVHQESWPVNLSETLFPDQTVTLAVPSDGSSTEREFTITYRGQPTKIRINFEQTAPGLTGATSGQAAINNSLIPWGFPANTTNSNLGTVFVSLQNSKLNCTDQRQLYWTMPASGTFGNSSSGSNPTASNFLSKTPLLPQNLIPNRGVYRTDVDGLAPGSTFSISLDDDADEYGRRNGYCSWTRRIYLTLTKL